MVCLAPVHPATEIDPSRRLPSAWTAAWSFAQLCLLLAAVALVPPAPTGSPSPASAPTSEARDSRARSVTVKSPSPEPKRPVAAAPATPNPTAPDTPVFYAGLHVGDAWLVLHRLAPAERSAARVAAAAVRALPLTQGETLLLTHLGPPAHADYTLVAGGETCTAQAVGQVRLELDSGEPGDHSALGPAWLADELRPCSLSHEPQIPFVAIAGKAQSHEAPTLAPVRVAQRVRFDPAAISDCEGNAEVFEAQLEIAGRKYAVTRVSSDPDALSVVELGGAVALSTRAALTWDSAGVGC